MTTPLSLTAILPTYNERDNIPILIAGILASVRTPVQVLVVDDNSPDGTWQVVQELAAQEPRVHLLLRTTERGLTSAIYTEVLQFFMIVLGFAPVVWLGMKDVGGWGALKSSLATVAQNPAALELNTKSFQPDAWTSAWKPLLAGPDANPMGVDWFAMVFGLGFVLSFGYWCTDFLVVQRAMAAEGAYFERMHLHGNSGVDWAGLAAVMRAVGIDRTVLVTDLGRTDAVDPVTGMQEMLAPTSALIGQGLGESVGLAAEVAEGVCTDVPPARRLACRMTDR